MSRKRHDLRLLGPFRLTTPEGTEVTLTTRKGIALLAYLAARPSWECHREQLASLLWGDLPEERARHNLRQAIAKLRRELPAPLVVSEGDALRIDDTLVEIDLWRFERARASDDLAAQSDALSLVKGEFLSGLTTRADGFDLWASDERARIKRSIDGALARLGEDARRHGRRSEVVELANQRIANDPACEEAYCALIEAHRDEGRRAAALAAFEACTDALARHLGVEPLPATRALVEGLGGEKARPVPDRAPSRGAPANVEALDCHTRASELYVRHTPEHNREAERLLRRALDLSPEFARAHARLAYVLVTDYINGWSAAATERLAEADRAARDAIRFDPEEPDAHVAAGLVAMWSRRLDEAIDLARRAIDLDPRFAGAYSVLGNALHFSGRHEEGLREIQAAMRLDGQHLGTYLLFLGRCHFGVGAYEHAVEAFRSRLLATPWSDVALVHLAACYGHLDRHAEARDAWRRVLEVNPRFSFRQKRRVLPYASSETFDRLIEGLERAGVETTR